MLLAIKTLTVIGAFQSVFCHKYKQSYIVSQIVGHPVILSLTVLLDSVN